MKFLLSIAVFLCVFASVAAQEDMTDSPGGDFRRPQRWFFGPGFGLLRDIYPAGMYNPHDIPEIGHFHEPYASSATSGVFFGINAEYKLSDSREAPSSLIARLLYSTNFHAEFTGKEEVHLTMDNEIEVNSLTRFLAGVEHSELALQLIYKHNLLGAFFGAVGTDIVYNIDSRVEYRQSIIEKNNAVFNLQDYEFRRGWSLSGDKRTVYFPVKELAPLRFAVAAGAGYEFQTQRGIIAPHLLFRLGLKRDQNTNLLIHALQFGLDFKFRH